MKVDTLWNRCGSLKGNILLSSSIIDNKEYRFKIKSKCDIKKQTYERKLESERKLYQQFDCS